MKNIGHLKVKSFYTRLIEQRHPDWRGHPIVVVGSMQQRSPVLALSDEARRQGVVTGQPLHRVLSRMPDVKVALADRGLYQKALDQIRITLSRYSPAIELASYSSSYIDLTGTRRLWGQPESLLLKIEQELRSGLGLPAVGGLAMNKLVSKVAADEAFRHQESILTVRDGDEKPFLAPHPVHILPDTAPDILVRLRDLNLLIVGDVQPVDPAYFRRIFGVAGTRLYQYAQGTDDRPVTPGQKELSLTEKIVFQEPTNDGERIRLYLMDGIHRLCRTLRSRQQSAGLFRLSVQFADHQTDHRQIGFPDGAFLERPVYDQLERLLSGILQRRIQVGLMDLTATRLFRTTEQLLLWDHRDITREEKLFTAMDRLEGKYGLQLVRFAGVA